MDLGILQVAGGLGVGAFLGFLIFIMYRIDRRDSEKRHLEAWMEREKRLSELLEADRETREENTKALTELTTHLMRMNGKKKYDR